VKMAARLVDTLHTKFDPTDYDDEYREAVLAVVERKRKGEDIVPEEQPETDDSADLMATLEASLQGAKGGR